MQFLRKSECCADGIVLQWPEALPWGQVLEGVYVDDHVVMLVCELADIAGGSGPDRDERSPADYKKCNW